MKCSVVLLVLLVLVLDQTESKDKERRRGKRKRDGEGKPKRHKPLKIKLVPPPTVLIGEEPPTSNRIGPESQDSPVNGPDVDSDILELLKTDSQYQKEPVFSEPPTFSNDVQEKWEQQQKRKDEARRKNKRRQEKQRRREQALRIQVKKKQDNWRKREKAEQRGQEEAELRKAEEEVQVWLRGDVFDVNHKETEEPTEPAPIPTPPAPVEQPEESEADLEPSKGLEEDLDEVFEYPGPDLDLEPGVDRAGLPHGCDISDVTVSCENAKLLYFPPLSIHELKSISLEGNNISSIPAEAFNGIPNVEWINLKKNKLTAGGIHPNAFRSLKFLTRLYLDGNLLETVPSGLPSTLQELKINENQLKEVHKNSLKGLKSLVILELEGNLLSEGGVDHGAFRDLSELSYLRLGRNHFRTIPQGLPPSLLELHVEHNHIEEISETVFNKTQSLTLVSLKNNRLEETRIAPLAWIHHRSLESLDLSNNHLHLVPSFLPQSLVHLVLVGNRIERIPGYVFAHMSPGLEYLYLSYNRLDGEGFEPESFLGTYNSMVELCLDHNQLINVPSGINEMTNLHFLRLNDNKIRTIPGDSLCDPGLNGETSLTAVRLDNNYIDPETVPSSAFSCVRASSSVVLKPQFSIKKHTRKDNN